jgi:hypothetical protein
LQATQQQTVRTDQPARRVIGDLSTCVFWFRQREEVRDLSKADFASPCLKPQIGQFAILDRKTRTYYGTSESLTTSHTSEEQTFILGAGGGGRQASNDQSRKKKIIGQEYTVLYSLK